ncbi:MAG TPA: malto-oligosyltrehalose synthase [Acetobacteraceae bacterium]
MTALRATMRLQLHRDFTFVDATKLVSYMAKLGISHLYSSPILTARAGSMHGYDVIDPTQVNPELGGEAGLGQLVAALHSTGLGLIVDVVPNHMAVGGSENPWWADVLRHGRNSRYASFFDIDWDCADPELRGKVLAPFLGEPYGDTLRNGSLTLVRDPDEPVIAYFDNRFPIRPEDHTEIGAASPDAFDPRTETGRARLHHLLERQHYRLAWWRTAGDLINWRRFFDINGLAALRIEHEAVFEATHAALFRLYRQGLIDGVRVDHVDGLADPPGYCRRLRTRLQELAPQRQPWVVVEKILGAGEHLPDDWAVDGTSGYDFMDQVSALLHARAGETPLRRLWSEISGRPSDFGVEEASARREVLDRSFTAQLEAAVAALHEIALADVATRDVTRAAIRRALTALLAHFPVYRSYGCGQRSAAVTTAVAGALPDVVPADRGSLGMLERWLGVDATPKAAIRFQQLSAPLAAKAVEDTAYYRYGVLLSRNEVGADVRRFSAPPAEFHAACLERRQRFPDAMLATATHDHKRGEDVRARLAVLSEIPDEWQRAVRNWFVMNTPHRRDGPMPSPGDEAMLYQMIVAAWPLDDTDLVEYADRLADWQLKALREAKLVTDWTAPNLEYEDAARSFLYTIMADTAFVAEARAFAERIGPAGAVNGLAQTSLKLTAPGVPDFYQGTEFWDLSLVDPDNRRPVDFVRRIDALGADRSPVELVASWRDGRVKQAVVRRALAMRREQPALFARGTYRPLDVSGPLAEHVVAFARSYEDAHCIVVVPRLPLTSHHEIGRTPQWQGTILHVPGNLAGRSMRDRFSGDVLAVGPTQEIEQVLGRFPVALLGA